MNASTWGGSKTAPASLDRPEFLYMSSHRSIRASGIAVHVDTPAAGGERGDGPFQLAVSGALKQARALGVQRPIVMGAIPFDVTQPSCLYVPTQHEFFDRVSAARQPTRALGAVVDARSIPDEPGFKAGVNQAIANFRHSDIKKAVLSRIFEIQLDAPVDVGHILGNLLNQNPNSYHFHIPMQDGSSLIGASPELLLRKQGAHIFSNPLAGSAKRQSDATQDRLVSETLRHSAKDNYEHSLVVDEIRNILAPHCRELDIPPGPSLINTAAMWHLSTSISGAMANPGTSVLQMACQLHPTPAVCGFPTGLSRKLINLIEPFERGPFTGMVGWCDEEGDGEWVVTIRCGTVLGNYVRLFAGAGIVEASCAESEWAETQAKLGTMLNAFGINAGAVTQ
jgi:isochorismate synthase